MAKDVQRRPRAETPKGFRDYFGAEVVERQAMLATIAEVYRMHGFEPLETSAVETAKALGKFLPDVDRPNEGVFAWQDKSLPDANRSDKEILARQDEEEAEVVGNNWLALRYDLTAPLARFYAERRNELPTPYRRYAMGPVWRNEKPGPGRFRQFYQCDADTVGTASNSVAADAEICAMLAGALEALGLGQDTLIRVNNRKVLNGVLETMNLVDHGENAGDTVRQSVQTAMYSTASTSIERAQAVLRTLDKFDKVGELGVRELLTEGRLDSSGAFIEGINLFDYQVEPVMRFLTAKSNTLSETLSNLREAVGTSKIGLEGINELEQIVELLDRPGHNSDRIMIDPSVVRGLGYYTGPVFEAELTFTVTDDKGRPRQFGSVAGGGRYDDLVKRFTGQEVPATGVSIGVDRLMAALRAKRGAAVAAEGPVIVTVMDRDRMADYMAMAAELRAGGIRAEVYLGNPKSFGNQLKYADKRGSPVAVIMGGDEAAKGTVILKDLILGAKIAEGASLEEWKARPAQVEVPRAGLVAAVREMLGR